MNEIIFISLWERKPTFSMLKHIKVINRSLKFSKLWSLEFSEGAKNTRIEIPQLNKKQSMGYDLPLESSCYGLSYGTY